MTSVQIRAIKSKYKAPDLRHVVQREIKTEARNVQREYEITTRTWSTDVDFEIDEKVFGGHDAGAQVKTDNKIYKYVDGGTKPHIIRAKNAKALRFNTKGFRAKTTPQQLTSRAGRPAQPPTAHPIQVKHPGTKARQFTKLIRKRSQKRFARNLNKGIKAGVRRGAKG